jgi:hypothetical protein
MNGDHGRRQCQAAKSRKELREAKEDLETVKTAASNSGSETAQKGKYGFAILHYISCISC